MAAQREQHLHLTEVTRLETYKGKQWTFEQSDKKGRLLAMLTQHDQPLTLVSTLRTPSGETITFPLGILQTFNTFYETLYASALPSDFQPEGLKDLLDPLALS